MLSVNKTLKNIEKIMLKKVLVHCIAPSTCSKIFVIPSKDLLLKLKEALRQTQHMHEFEICELREMDGMNLSI
jgi:hypothetical protein